MREAEELDSQQHCSFIAFKADSQKITKLMIIFTYIFMPYSLIISILQLRDTVLSPFCDDMYCDDINSPVVEIC